MSKVDILEVKKTILEDNDADANVLREELKKQKLCYLNLMSSPGSGKTTTLLSLLKAIDHRIEVGVMEADIDSDVDARTIADAGYKSIQLHTGGMCHLDAEMSRQGMMLSCRLHCRGCGSDTRMVLYIACYCHHGV